MTVLGTAGHVDHGKSTLVRALTGIDPDTLAAEKERGLTIDLGFAVAPLPSGRRVHLVDVPGHVRFLKNMLAGAGAVSGVVFVVDAMEGPRAQSTEHLQLLDLLGVHDGVVVITKADLVSGERLDDAVLETLMFLDGSPLAEADPIVVDSVTGRGMDRLRTGLDALVDRVGRPPADGRARLWIDRAFTAAGAGTVVAGLIGQIDLRKRSILDGRVGEHGHGEIPECAASIRPSLRLSSLRLPLGRVRRASGSTNDTPKGV